MTAPAPENYTEVGVFDSRTVSLRAGLGGAALAVLAGCGSVEEAPKETLTSGQISVVVEPIVAATIRASAEEFEQLYPEATIEVREGTVREGIGALYLAEAQMAVVGRELDDEERDAALSAGLEVEAHRWALDGVAVVTHPNNPVEQVAFDDLKEIYTGSAVTWDAYGGTGRRVVPVVQDEESGIQQFFRDWVLAGGDVTAPAQVADGDSAVVAYVAGNPDAVGFVSLPFADRGVKALRVSRLKGLPYVGLDARTVYEKRYPLTRYYNLVLRRTGSRLARGFATYLCGSDGQRWVKDRGLVPATVPVNFTVRTPTLPAHGRGEGDERE